MVVVIMKGGALTPGGKFMLMFMVGICETEHQTAIANSIK